MYSDIRKSFQKKKINEDFDKSINLNNDLESVARYLNTMERSISNFDQNFKKWLKNDKKSDKIIDLLNEEIKEKDNEIYVKDKKLKEEHRKNLKIYKKVIEIIDSIDAIYEYIYEYTKNTNNESLKLNINNVYKKINRYLNDIGIEEINSKMEVMDPELHECVEVKDIDEFNSIRIAEDKVVENTIVDVIKKGYKLDGKVLRVAKVTIVQNKKMALK